MTFNNASCDSTEISSETVHKLISKFQKLKPNKLDKLLSWPSRI